MRRVKTGLEETKRIGEMNIHNLSKDANEAKSFFEDRKES